MDNGEPASNHEERVQWDNESVDVSYDRSILRLGIVLVVAFIFETGMAYSVIRPDWVDAALDCLARAGRIAVLGLPMFVLLSIARRLRPLRNPRVPALVTTATAWCCAPRRALPLVTLYGILIVVFTHTIASGYDYAWRVAGVFALVPIGVVGLVLIVVSVALRGKNAPERGRPSVFGQSLWTAVAFFLVFFIFARIEELKLVVAPTIVVACVFVPISWRPRKSVGLGVAVVVCTLSAGAGLLLDVYLPSIRRLASVYTPVSNIGLKLLLRATDFDFDGSSGVLGLDCDDFDDSRSPAHDDVPDDGIDQNCTGRDGSFLRARIRSKRGGPRWSPPIGPRVGQPPDIVLITVDALRHDVVSPSKGATLMPEVARYFERRCIFFDNARSNNNYTAVSLINLMSGTLPRHTLRGSSPMLGVPRDPNARQPSIPPSLASTLKASGYRTAAVVALDELSSYQRYGVDRVVFFSEQEHRDITAVEVLGHARRVMREGREEEPLYLWIHLLDAHAPYTGGMSRADYERTAGLLDGPLASFLSEQPPETLVIVTADHGEAFGEHGTFTHGNTLFEEEVRIPFAICSPEAAGLGSPRVVETSVGLIDIAPTVLELVGVEAPYPRQGESLVSHLRHGAPLRSPWVVMEEWLEARHLQALVLGDWKWIRDHDLQWEGLFNIAEDPGERREVSAQHPEEFRQLRALFYEILDDDLDSYRSWRIGRRERPLPGRPPTD